MKAGVVDAEPGRGAGRIAFDQYVGGLDQGQEVFLVGFVLEVIHRAALAAVPDLVAKLVAERIAAGWLDLGYLGAIVGQQHRGHRTGDAPGEVENLQLV